MCVCWVLYFVKSRTENRSICLFLLLVKVTSGRGNARKCGSEVTEAHDFNDAPDGRRRYRPITHAEMYITNERTDRMLVRRAGVSILSLTPHPKMGEIQNLETCYFFQGFI